MTIIVTIMKLLRTIVTIIASYLLWPIGFFSFRAEVLQPAAEAPVISAVPPLRSSESLSNTLWFHWCGFKDDGSIFHFIYGIYMGYIILSSCHPIDELHHFSRWAHCTSNQFAELGIDLLVLNAGNSRE